jgi:hypothetical protein
MDKAGVRVSQNAYVTRKASVTAETWCVCDGTYFTWCSEYEDVHRPVSYAYNAAIDNHYYR